MGGLIVAGTVEDAVRDSAQWIFVDLGFSEKSKSCCIAIGDEEPVRLTFCELQRELCLRTRSGVSPINLVIEAPLSVSFNAHGNPTGRHIERRCSRTRYWYVGPGAAVLIAATYLMRRLVDSSPLNEVRLFEGFASFKHEGARTSHADDVRALRDVVWRRGDRGRIVGPNALKRNCADVLQSAFTVAGMDLGVPAVVLVEDEL